MKNIYSVLIKLTAASVLVGALTSCGGAEERKLKYLEKSKVYLEEKNYDKARIELKNALQIDNKYAEAYYLMGRLEERDKAFIKAIANYKKSLELDPSHIDSQIKLATIYVIAGTDDYISQAKKILDDVNELDPNNSEAAFVNSTILYKSGGVDQAIKKMVSIIKDDNHLVGGIVMLSNIYISKSRDGEAIELLQKGVYDNPKDVYLLTSLARIQAKNGDLISAENNIKKAIEIDSDTFSLKVGLSAFYARTNQLDKAQSILREGIEQAPNDASRYLVLSQLLVSKVSVESAEKELLTAIKNKPNLFDLKFALIKLYRRIGKRKEAKAILRNIVEEERFDVNGVKARNQLAEMFLEEGDIVQAKINIDEVLAEYPHENESIFMSSKIALSKNDAITAINGFRTVVKNNPKLADASLLLAQAYEMNNEASLAETELKRAIETNPVDDKVHINYARYLASKGRTSEATSVVDRALTYFKDSYGLLDIKLKISASQGSESDVLRLLDMMEQTDSTKDEVNITRGQYFLSKKNADKALEQFEIAYTKSRDKYKALELIVKTYVANKQPNKALDKLRSLKQQPAVSALAYHLSAKVNLSQGDLKSAREEFSLASKTSAKWSAPYLGLAATYVSENNYDKAEKVLQSALSEVDDKVSVYIQLASLYERQMKFDEAMNAYKDILEIKETNLVAKNNYASLLLDHGDADDFVKALSLVNGLENVQSPAFKDTIAWGYAKTGDYTKAVEMLSSVVKTSPGVAVFRYHLGYALYYMGDKSAAKSHLEIAVASKQSFTGKVHAQELLKSI